MGNLLFNPNGRITSGPFWTGIFILLGVSILINVLAAYVSTFLGFVAILLIYPMVCVYGKRLHDAGFSAWLILAVLVAGFIVGQILSLILVPMLAGDVQAEMMEAMMDAGSDMSAIMQITQDFQKDLLPATLAVAVIQSLAMAAVVAFLPTQQQTNKHGPVPGTDGTDDSATFE